MLHEIVLYKLVIYFDVGILVAVRVSVTVSAFDNV